MIARDARRVLRKIRQVTVEERESKSDVCLKSDTARDEAGAVLVLALVFLMVAGGIIGSLVTWSTLQGEPSMLLCRVRDTALPIPSRQL